MAKLDIARALKDRGYFNSLTEEEKAQVRAANPSGDVDVNDDDLDSVSGGLGERIAAITGTGSTAVGSFDAAEPVDPPQNCNCNC